MNFSAFNNEIISIRKYNPKYSHHLRIYQFHESYGLSSQAN